MDFDDIYREAVRRLHDSTRQKEDLMLINKLRGRIRAHRARQAAAAAKAGPWTWIPRERWVSGGQGFIIYGFNRPTLTGLTENDVTFLRVQGIKPE